MAQPTSAQGDRSPTFIYGTAWKEQRTEALTALAIEAGFRAIDTANQRKHYFEAGVGVAVAAAIAAGKVTRDEIFLQTKYTYERGQDHRLPYDARADIGTQVAQSFASSLEHLRVTFLDSYLLHGPWSARGWSVQDREAWKAMETLHDTRAARRIGVSNVALAQLKRLCDEARVPPAFVQNRCYASTGWDREVREFCRSNGIVYQGFSLLTANRTEMAAAEVTRLAKRMHATVPQVVFSFALAVGMLPLTGTCNRAHMKADLAASSIDLTPADVAMLERVADPG